MFQKIIQITLSLTLSGKSQIWIMGDARTKLQMKAFAEENLELDVNAAFNQSWIKSGLRLRSPKGLVEQVPCI
jgi:hypothetical protein